MSKRKKTIMRTLKINEISGVDVPAQEGALAVIMKRADRPNKSVEKGAFAKSSALTSPEDGHSHLIALNGPPDGVQLVSGETSWADGHTHPWVMLGGGEIVIGTATGSTGNPHTHRTMAMSKVAGEDDDPDALEGVDEDDMETKGGGKKKKIVPPVKKNLPANVAGDETGNKETDMSGNDQKSTDEVAKLTKALALATTMASLSDMEKAHYATLDADTTGADYLAKDASDRASIAKSASDVLAKAALDSDPVVYTTADGIELRKSAGAALIAVTKSNDILAKQLAESLATNSNVALEKRAETELGNMPGSVQERAAMLKAVDAIEDEGQRNASLAALKASNDAMGKSFETVGHGGAPVVAGSGAADLDTLVKAHVAANAGVTEEAAMDAVLKTAEGSAAYTKSLN